MSSNSYFASAPTVVMPPAPDRFFVNTHYARPKDRALLMHSGLAPTGLANSKPFTPTPAASALAPIAGRKRSRGDIYAPDEDEDDSRALSSASACVSSAPSDAMVVEVPSMNQADEHIGRITSELAHQERPPVTSRKSQRMNSSPSGPDDLAQLVLPPTMREATTEPLIDEATRALGISWTRMDSTEALQIGQKAYSKWIQNHYSGLQNVSVWFENSAIPGYLVAATNAYNGQLEYLIFSDDLTEARRVTNDPSQLVPRLKMLPALHLAAPGGCLKAETDPITTAQNEINNVLVERLDGAAEGAPPSGACAAHTMELD